MGGAGNRSRVFETEVIGTGSESDFFLYVIQQFLRFLWHGILRKSYKPKRSGKHMRIIKNLKTDQDNYKRFLDVLGGGSVILGKNNFARPSFFILAHGFIHEYIEQGFFKKEEYLIQKLEDVGFPSETGPVGSIQTDHKKCRDAADVLIRASKEWQGGDEVARSEVVWAVSEYTSASRQHLDRLKNLIIPLLEQTFPQMKNRRSLMNLIISPSKAPIKPKRENTSS